MSAIAREGMKWNKIGATSMIIILTVFILMIHSPWAGLFFKFDPHYEFDMMDKIVGSSMAFVMFGASSIWMFNRYKRFKREVEEAR